MTKRRLGLCSAMVRFAPAAPFDDETPAADPLGERPSPCRGGARAGSPRHVPRRPTHCLNGYFRLGRDCQKSQPSAPTPPVARLSSPAPASLCSTPILHENPPFAGALRQRLALRAAAACVKMARLREDAAGLRDAEHLAPGAGTTQTSPAGRIHRLWRLFASRPMRLDASTLRIAADLVGLTDATSFDGLAGALRDIVAGAEHPLAAAVGASAAAMKLLSDAPPVDVEIFALWLSDLALAQRLRWDAPVPLLATTITHASLRRGPSGKRPRPADPDWVDAAAGAYAMAAQEAYALAGELARAGEKLLAAQPKLRAKSAGRVIELLLSDDAVSPARAAKAARLSDRAARRLFDRLIELGAVRELSGRPNFRFYGL